MADLEAFVAVAEGRSFSAAARRLSLTPAAVSKAVIRLEQRLGVRLFTRTTRRVVPTAEGEAFHLRARDILHRMADAEAEVGTESREPVGEVGIGAPALLGQNVIVPLLAKLRDVHPRVTLDLHLSDAFHGLVGGGIDLALRLGDLKDSRLLARRLCSTRFVTCAAPAYLQRFGTPASPDDLRSHSCVTYMVHDTGRPFALRFAEGRAITPERSVVVRDGAANRAAAIAGLGLIQGVDVAIRPDLLSGALVEVLRSDAAVGPALSLVQPAGRFVPRRVKAVGDFLVDAFSGG